MAFVGLQEILEVVNSTVQGPGPWAVLLTTEEILEIMV